MVALTHQSNVQLQQALQRGGGLSNFSTLNVGNQTTPTHTQAQLSINSGATPLTQRLLQQQQQARNQQQQLQQQHQQQKQQQQQQPPQQQQQQTPFKFGSTDRFQVGVNPASTLNAQWNRGLNVCLWHLDTVCTFIHMQRSVTFQAQGGLNTPTGLQGSNLQSLGAVSGMGGLGPFSSALQQMPGTMKKGIVFLPLSSAKRFSFVSQLLLFGTRPYVPALKDPFLRYLPPSNNLLPP